MTEEQAYAKATCIARVAVAGNAKPAEGPEWHPAEQDPLAWWGCVEACMSLYQAGVKAGLAMGDSNVD